MSLQLLLLRCPARYPTSDRRIPPQSPATPRHPSHQYRAWDRVKLAALLLNQLRLIRLKPLLVNLPSHRPSPTSKFIRYLSCRHRPDRTGLARPSALAPPLGCCGALWEVRAGTALMPRRIVLLDSDPHPTMMTARRAFSRRDRRVGACLSLWLPATTRQHGAHITRAGLASPITYRCRIRAVGGRVAAESSGGSKLPAVIANRHCQSEALGRWPSAY